MQVKYIRAYKYGKHLGDYKSLSQASRQTGMHINSIVRRLKNPIVNDKYAFEYITAEQVIRLPDDEFTIRTCPICGSKFKRKLTDGSIKFCSDECRKISNKKSIKKSAEHRKALKKEEKRKPGRPQRGSNLGLSQMNEEARKQHTTYGHIQQAETLALLGTWEERKRHG